MIGGRVKRKAPLKRVGTGCFISPPDNLGGPEADGERVAPSATYVGAVSRWLCDQKTGPQVSGTSTASRIQREAAGSCVPKFTIRIQREAVAVKRSPRANHVINHQGGAPAGAQAPIGGWDMPQICSGPLRASSAGVAEGRQASSLHRQSSNAAARAASPLWGGGGGGGGGGNAVS